MPLSAEQILAGKPTDIYRMYVPKVQFVQCQSNFFQQTATQVKALAGYPQLLKTAVNPDLPFRNIWGYVMSDLSQTVTLNDCDLVATLDGLEQYRQKLWRVSTVSATYDANCNFSGGFTTLAANQSVQNEVLFVQLALGEFFFHPIRLNITADTFYIEVKTLTDTGAAKYDGQLFVRSQVGI
jgi:hypothetical protein